MRRMFAAAAILLAFSGDSRAQMMFIGPGSTLEGDYLRGVGVAGWGMGLYNLNTAQATSINADTEMRVNEYIFQSQMNANRMHAERKAAIAERAKRLLQLIRDRIDKNPEARDVRTGDSLNKVLEQLDNPRIQETNSRESSIPLSVDEVRRIPFKVGEKGVRQFSIARLTAKDKGKWPVAFQDDRFDRDRRSYERALDHALEQQYKGRVQLDSIDQIQKAVEQLDFTLERVVGRVNDKLYFEARDRIKEMRETVDMLKVQQIEQALGDLDRYAGTTVNDLRLFMQKHHLQFADASTPEERELFPMLYGKLTAQRDKVSVGLPAAEDGFNK